MSGENVNCVKVSLNNPKFPVINAFTTTAAINLWFIPTQKKVTSGNAAAPSSLKCTKVGYKINWLIFVRAVITCTTRILKRKSLNLLWIISFDTGTNIKILLLNGSICVFILESFKYVILLTIHGEAWWFYGKLTPLTLSMAIIYSWRTRPPIVTWPLKIKFFQIFLFFEYL